MKNNKNRFASRSVAVRNTAFAFLAGTVGLAGLVSGATCSPASQKTVGFAGDPVIPGNSVQVAAQGPVASATISNGRLRQGTVSAGDDAKIAILTAKLLENSHYSQPRIDDSLSPKVFDEYLDTLDPQRVYFLQSDYDEFAGKYRNTIVGLTANKGDFTPAQEMYNRLLQRAQEQTDYANQLLKDDSVFTYTGNDTFTIDRAKADRPKTAEEAQDLWKQRIRYEYLQEKLTKEKQDEIVKKLSGRYDRSLRTLRELDSDDLFELYMNTIVHALDPHTDYFGKASAENFSISMKLSLYGIGATLKSEDGYTVIEEIKPGSPAAKSGKLHEGDKIVAVAQGKTGAFADVVEMKLNRVVEQIRGEKGSVVRLRIIPADSSDPSAREVVTLVRDEIKLEESAAKAQLVVMPQADGKKYRLGVIDLPLFYQDPEKGKSCSEDVKLLLTKLKEQKVDGVILDLRGNGGGSLPEAIKMAGLFIKTGPVVQVKKPGGEVTVDEDTDPSVAYAGPLVVLTSRTSASASEIVTGALQDYGRGLVVGDSSSFGKGTVQALVGLADIMDRSNIAVADDPGQLKLTIQKFYRASGASTQLRGVVPNIILPSVNDALKIGEKDLDNPLPWDEIKSARYTKTNSFTPYVAELSKRSTARVAANPDFRYLKDAIARIAKLQDEKTISLNEAERVKEQQEEDARSDARQKVLASRAAPSVTVYPITLADSLKPGLPKPLTAAQIRKGITNEDAAAPIPSTEDKKTKAKLPEPDAALTEAEHILSDYVTLAKPKAAPVAKQP